MMELVLSLPHTSSRHDACTGTSLPLPDLVVVPRDWHSVRAFMRAVRNAGPTGLQSTREKAHRRKQHNISLSTLSLAGKCKVCGA